MDKLGNKNESPRSNFQDLLLQYQAFALYQGKRGPNFERIKKLFMESATDQAFNKNDPEAIYWLCYDAVTAPDGNPLDAAKIISMLESVTGLRYAPALHLLGNLYCGHMGGAIVPLELRNHKRGLSLIRQAVSLDFGPAFNTLCAFYDRQVSNTWYYGHAAMRLAKTFAARDYPGAFLYLAEQALLKKPQTMAEKRNVVTLLERGLKLSNTLRYEDEYIADNIRFRLGVCLYEGFAGIPDQDKGLELIELARKSCEDSIEWRRSKGLYEAGEYILVHRDDLKEARKPEEDDTQPDESSFRQGDFFTTLKQPLFPQQTIKNTISDTDLSAEKIEALLKPLDDMTGLGSIKDEIRRLISMVRVQDQRRRAGLKTDPVTLHMVFGGNPGTGKTSVARLLGDIFKGLGLLSKGHVVEVGRDDLIGEYIGHTENQTKRVLNRAKGGILFIDEAYTLSDSSSERDFGWNAIDTIAKAMENERDDMIVIVAGYQDEMKNFLKATPGLASRFPYQINFPDYTVEEMAKIFTSLCNEHDYTLAEEAHPLLVNGLKMHRNKADKNFGNARFVRELFERTQRRQAQRLSASPEPSKEQLMQIEAHDLAFTGPVGDGKVTYLR